MSGGAEHRDRPGPERAAVAPGNLASGTGEDDWADSWLASLDETGPWAAQSRQRGEALVRRGRVTGVQITAGRVSAQVREDRVAPYDVRLTLPVPSDTAWERAVSALAGELRTTAALLDGRATAHIDETMAASGAPLLPRSGELGGHCTCADPETLCVHVAALHHAVAHLLERDPFVLFLLRGRSRDRVLDELRARRSGIEGQQTAASLGVADSSDLLRARGDVEAVELHPAPVEDPAMLFHHLGPPPGVDDTAELEGQIERAAAMAWRLAAGEGAVAAADEVLVAELRSQRTATAEEVAGSLGREVVEVRAALDRLFEHGAVLRTGQPDRARYRAASRGAGHG